MIICIPGNPQSQQRPRFFVRSGKTCTYDPQSAFKKDLKKVVLSQLPSDFVKPVSPTISFLFYMPIPTSLSSESKRNCSKGIIKHLKKPDVDNLVKLYLDVLSGVALIDDNCVQINKAIKIYSDKPRTIIYIKSDENTLNQNEIEFAQNLEFNNDQ